jgi:hypothetical protein
MSEILPTASADLRQFPSFYRPDVIIGHAEGINKVLVQHGLGAVAVDYGAERKFRLVGSTDLAHENEVQRGVQGRCHFVPDGDPTAREGKNHRVLAFDMQKAAGQLPSRIGPVLEPWGHQSGTSRK